MKYEVIDNFLDKEYFDSLVTFFFDDQMPWRIITDFVEKTEVQNKLFLMCHHIYSDHMPTSPAFDKIFPLLQKLEANHLLRIKANLYPSSETLQEHIMHVDFDYSHCTALFSLNTCDGYTKLKDGTKINSVANRVLLFDASEEHCSTTTTDNFARVNININYLTKQFLMKGYNDNQQKKK